ncbi:ice-structuring glycoprotein-like [Musca domestica]|uniref:Ice-structuring glycoprotein-like n=1 Tax=Musca domestica TaxID=7370 RepID=A0ABM3VCL1_MUSDO|nr:ice-structuring glycoprotein-like [Musca domestica]
MKFIILFALVAAVAAQQVSNEYLPPHFDLGGASYSVSSVAAPEASYAAESYDVGASAPAHTFSEADGYRYKTHRRRVYKTARRHRRDVSTEYLPPAASSVSTEYLPPAASAPAASYAAPAASYESYDVGASAPAHSFSEADGYRYKTQRRRVYKTARRHRRDVSTEYLPPAASAPVASYESYEAAPAASYESYDVAASAPAHSFSEADGYRYKTHRRRVFKTARRHRRDVSTEYLPPAASAVSTEYLPPAASAPAVSYAAPAASYETYDVGASAPAHSFSEADGYRYKTHRRRVFKTARRHRRDVSTEYLPPAASAPVASYESYETAPAASYESYDVAASAPAHSFSEADGYRYKTHRRRVFKTARRHRKLFIVFALVAAAAAQLSNEYLPPNVGAASAPAVSYSAAPAASYESYETAAAPAASYESYEVAAAAPAHTFSEADGYRYKTHRRRVFKTARRHRRDVSTEYLPPAASAPAVSYAAPAASYESYETAAAPAASYESYEVAAAAPAHSFSEADGYRYKTHRRRVFKTARRHRRDVSTEYLPPAASSPAVSYAAPAAPAASYESYETAAAPAASYESYEVAAAAPAHSFSETDGYRYKTHRRRVFKTARRHRRDVSTEYLPPAASAPAVSYAAPAASYESYEAAAAPAASYESYEVAAAAPAHSFSEADGYRYKTHRRRVFKTARRHRRDVSAEYLPPLASNSVSTYEAPAAYESYEVEASAPAHSYSDAEGYRYRTQRRRVFRRRRV